MAESSEDRGKRGPHTNLNSLPPPICMHQGQPELRRPQSVQGHVLDGTRGCATGRKLSAPMRVGHLATRDDGDAGDHAEL